jgi:hypothetical protein
MKTAEQILKAIQANDAELLATLLKAFVSECEMEDEEEEDSKQMGPQDEMAAGKKAIPYE